MGSFQETTANTLQIQPCWDLLSLLSQTLLVHNQLILQVPCYPWRSKNPQNYWTVPILAAWVRVVLGDWQHWHVQGDAAWSETGQLGEMNGPIASRNSDKNPVMQSICRDNWLNYFLSPRSLHMRFWTSVGSWWLGIGQALFCLLWNEEVEANENANAKTKEANIQPSRPNKLGQLRIYHTAKKRTFSCGTNGGNLELAK